MDETGSSARGGEIWRVRESLAWLQEVQDAILEFWSQRPDQTIASDRCESARQAYRTTVAAWISLEKAKLESSTELEPVRGLVAGARSQIDQVSSALLGLAEPRAYDLAEALKEIFGACQQRMEQELARLADRV
jgi:hypothetical protein